MAAPLLGREASQLLVAVSSACRRPSACPGERRRGLLVAVLVEAPAWERGGVAYSSLSLSLSSLRECTAIAICWRSLNSVRRARIAVFVSVSSLSVRGLNPFTTSMRQPCPPLCHSFGSFCFTWMSHRLMVSAFRFLLGSAGALAGHARLVCLGPRSGPTKLALTGNFFS